MVYNSDTQTMIKNETLSTKCSPWGGRNSQLYVVPNFPLHFYHSSWLVLMIPLPASMFCCLHLEAEDLTCDG